MDGHHGGGTTGLVAYGLMANLKWTAAAWQRYETGQAPGPAPPRLARGLAAHADIAGYSSHGQTWIRVKAEPEH